MSDTISAQDVSAQAVSAQDADRTVRRRLPRPSWYVACSLIAFAALAVSVWPSRFGGVTTYVVVAGRSMEPTFHSGDLVVARADARYEPGQVVVYRVPGRRDRLMVVHRIRSERADGTLVIQGDNNPTSDPWSVRQADVMGREVLVIPRIGVILRRILSPLPMGLVFGLAVAWWQWPTKDEERAEAQVPVDDDGMLDGPPHPDHGRVTATAAAIRSAAADHRALEDLRQRQAEPSQADPALSETG